MIGILLEYKYLLLVVLLALISSLTYFFNIINEIDYFDYSNSIQTKFLQLQDFATDLENWWNLKTLQDVIINANWNLRWTEDKNKLFWLTLQWEPNEIELITWYDNTNPYYFLWKNEDKTLDIDIDWNHFNWEANDIITVSEPTNLKIYFLDSEKTVSWVVKTKVKDIDIAIGWLINKGWWIDWILYVFESEEKAKKINSDILIEWTLVNVDDWFWIDVLAWVLMPFTSGVAVVDAWQSPFSYCVFQFSNYPCTLKTTP